MLKLKINCRLFLYVFLTICSLSLTTLVSSHPIGNYYQGKIHKSKTIVRFSKSILDEYQIPYTINIEPQFNPKLLLLFSNTFLLFCVLVFLQHSLKKLEQPILGINKEENNREKTKETLFTLDTQWFEWKSLWLEPLKYPHLIIYGATGTGKTTFVDWICRKLPHEDGLTILTIKSVPGQWKNLNVFGVPENFGLIHRQLERVESDRKSRLLLAQSGGLTDYQLIIIDEVRAIVKNCLEISEKPKGEPKVVLVNSASKIITDQITQAREAKQRLILIGQGDQVTSIGLKGESSLKNCLTQIYLGQMAIKKCSLYLNSRELSARINLGETHLDDWQIIYNKLKESGKRAAWVICEHGNYPCIVPEIEL